jgi:hypothetical protein
MAFIDKREISPSVRRGLDPFGGFVLIWGWWGYNGVIT